jgi:hypothetical protein
MQKSRFDGVDERGNIFLLCFIGVISSARTIFEHAFSRQKIARSLVWLGCGGRVYASLSVLSKKVITPS